MIDNDLIDIHQIDEEVKIEDSNKIQGFLDDSSKILIHNGKPNQSQIHEIKSYCRSLRKICVTFEEENMGQKILNLKDEIF